MFRESGVRLELDQLGLQGRTAARDRWRVWENALEHSESTYDGTPDCSGFLLPPKSADTRSLVKKYLVSRKNGFQQNQSNDYSLEAQRTLSIDNIC